MLASGVELSAPAYRALADISANSIAKLSMFSAQCIIALRQLKIDAISFPFLCYASLSPGRISAIVLVNYFVLSSSPSHTDIISDW